MVLDPNIRRTFRYVAAVLVITAICFWTYTIVQWIRSDPGFEPIHAVLSASVTVLFGVFRWLGTAGSKKSDELQFSVISCRARLERGGVLQSGNSFEMCEEIALKFRFRICAHNPCAPVSTRISIGSIDPAPLSDCLVGGSQMNEIKVLVSYEERPGRGPRDLGNPFEIPPGDRNIEVAFVVRFGVSEIERTFGTLASLAEVNIGLKAVLQATHQDVPIQPQSIDLAAIHAAIEKEAVSKMPKYPHGSARPIDTEGLVKLLKRYWIGPS